MARKNSDCFSSFDGGKTWTTYHRSGTKSDVQKRSSIVKDANGNFAVKVKARQDGTV